MKRALVIGGGVGGLSASIALAQRDVAVTVCEASPFFGGLASALQLGATRFDGGPYILLDPVGLEAAFEALGISIAALELCRVDDVYVVEREDAPPVRFFGSLDRTVEAWERDHPGQGLKYRAFVAEMTRIHRALTPLQTTARPSPLALVRAGALRHAPFLLRSLASVLARAGFSPAIADAVGIWTHVAGQPLARAPSPLALVPAMIHGPGCFVPARGVAAVSEAVTARAREVGVQLRERARVARICVEHGRARGVELVTGERLDADVVVSDASGLSTLLELAPVPPRARAALAALPLQSPGLAAYGLTSTSDGGPYLQFRLVPENAEAPCRLVVRPAALPRAPPAETHPTRIVAPLAHEVAERLGATGQGELLDAILAEPWVRDRVSSFHELARRVPASWGQRHVLYRDSMNPVMTARFMRQGRLPHRVDGVEALYQVGSSTHPGQWVSFCLLSGLYGARAAAAWLDGERA